MATQNPIETEGTYPLPEAQVDRFMMKVLVDYPTEEEEFVIAQRVTGPAATVSAVASMGQLGELQQECRQGVCRPVADAVRGEGGERHPPPRSSTAWPTWPSYITYGASPRATIGLIEGARALAFMRGRSYALPEDMTVLIPDVLRHRLVLSVRSIGRRARRPTNCCERVIKKIAGARQTARHARALNATRPWRKNQPPRPTRC